MHLNFLLRSAWHAKFLPFAAVILIPFALNSCAHTSDRQFAPGYSDARLSNLKTFYVRNDSEDQEDKQPLAADLVSELNSLGYKATTGSSQRPPSKVDAVISFSDQWMWDITMYMLSLELQLREPGSDTVFATAKTVRTSLVRKSQKEMVRETLSKLLKNQ
jgi:hypothetical protein